MDFSPHVKEEETAMKLVTFEVTTVLGRFSRLGSLTGP